jgi:MoxR-like ATPase
MNMTELIKAIWFTPAPKGRWGLNMIFEGRPGSAKTAHIEESARLSNLHIETVIASLREPADFNGLPIPTESKGGGTRVIQAPPHWAQALVDAKRGVGFFDEINTAPPSVQAALLRVVLDGVVGDLKLPPTARFVAAMNATEEAAGGWDLAAPLANRFGHWSWQSPDAESWGDWLLGSTDAEETKFDPEKEEERVIKAFPGPFAKARGLVSGFVRARPELLLKMPKAGDPAASKAWPSPRTWEMASRAIAGAEVHGLDEVTSEMLVSAFIGSGPASELGTYRRKADLPDPADVLDGKVTFKHDPKRLDRTVAVFSGCAALVTSPSAAKRDIRAATLWKLMTPIIGDAADVIVPAARALVRAKLQTFPEARSILLKIQPVLQAAGITPGT